MAVPEASSVTLPSTLVPSMKLTTPVASLPFCTLTVRTNPCAVRIGFPLVTKVMDVLCRATCKSTLEVLTWVPASPRYCAVRACWPATKLEVVRVATPFAIALLPRGLDPSRNITVPVGASPRLATFAVRVTAFPTTAGLELEAIVMVVPALLTDSERAAERLVRLCESPE